MTIFYETIVDGFPLLGSDHEGFNHNYKSLSTFFRYCFTPERIRLHFMNTKNRYKESKNIEIKVYSVSGNIFDGSNFKLVKTISRIEKEL